MRKNYFLDKFNRILMEQNIVEIDDQVEDNSARTECLKKAYEQFEKIPLMKCFQFVEEQDGVNAYCDIRFNLDKGTLQFGSCTNACFLKDGEIEYDCDHDLDWNLLQLLDQARQYYQDYYREHPEEK